MQQLSWCGTNTYPHILMPTALQKIDIDPEQQLYTSKIVDIAAAAIPLDPVWISWNKVRPRLTRAIIPKPWSLGGRFSVCQSWCCGFVTDPRPLEAATLSVVVPSHCELVRCPLTLALFQKRRWRADGLWDNNSMSWNGSDPLWDNSTGWGEPWPTAAWDDEEWVYPSGYSNVKIIITAFMVTCVMILIVVGNMLVCIAIATEKALKTVQNWFIASLAVSDFLVGLVIMPFSLANELMGYWIFGTIWCEIHSALDVLLCSASINNLCLISLDRYWSITQAVDYIKKRTPSRAIAMIIFVWLLSAVISLPPLLGWKKPNRPKDYPTCQLSDDIGYVLYSAFGSFYIPCIVMVFVYCRIFVAARARARRHVKKSHTPIPEYTNDPIKEKSTTTTTTTCTSFSNPSPPEKPQSNGGKCGRLIPPPAPQIVIDTSCEPPSNNSPSPRDLNCNSEGRCEETSKPIALLKSPEQDRRLSLLCTSNLTRSPYGSTLSLADYGRDDEDSDSKSRKRNKNSGHPGVRRAATDAEKHKRRIAKARERRATLILGLIMASFILAWLPFFVLYVLEAVCKTCSLSPTGFAVAFWLGYCNSALNPIIYTIFNRDFRRAFKKILFK
ncbi:ADRA2B [Cordylochernes scorpioides]|uniref:ADRA2B n=1 Tax=Cordylochernes scorpioides TaxID=51811 RepID=A0ABY6KDD0_9ARAC|nr:ADRA2B [Cordylochernes scorpioides]